MAWLCVKQTIEKKLLTKSVKNVSSACTKLSSSIKFSIASQQNRKIDSAVMAAFIFKYILEVCGLSALVNCQVDFKPHQFALIKTPGTIGSHFRGSINGGEFYPGGTLG